jgi:hypothetical protein
VLPLLRDAVVNPGWVSDDAKPLGLISTGVGAANQAAPVIRTAAVPSSSVVCTVMASVHAGTRSVLLMMGRSERKTA